MVENIFIIGGAQIYKECMEKNLYTRIIVTKIKKNYNCDVFFPEICSIKNRLIDCDPTKFPEFELCLEVYQNQDLHKMLFQDTQNYPSQSLPSQTLC